MSQKQEEHFACTGRDTKRVSLHEVVPMNKPFAIGIATSDLCNFRCIYCNHSTESKIKIKDARILSWENFLIIEKQIKELIDMSGSKLKILRFIGNGEPLMNKQTPNIIKYCVDRNLAERYEVTTNASLLTHEMTDRLIESGLTRLLVSVQGVTEERYKEICKHKIDYEKFVEKIHYFYEKSRGKCVLYIKIANVSLRGEEEKFLFYKTFEPICDQISIENIIESSDGVDFGTFMLEKERGKKRYNDDTQLLKKKCCDTLFMYMNIHSNGDVDVCGCLYPPLYIGNLFKLPLIKIWNGKVHKEFMIKHLTNRRNEIGVCAKCVSIDNQGGFPEDDLDPYVDEILERVKEL